MSFHKRTHSYGIVRQVYPPVTKAWRICEFMSTLDGTRTRLTHTAFATEAEARAEIDDLENDARIADMREEQ